MKGFIQSDLNESTQEIDSSYKKIRWNGICLKLLAADVAKLQAVLAETQEGMEVVPYSK